MAASMAFATSAWVGVSSTRRTRPALCFTVSLMPVVSGAGELVGLAFAGGTPVIAGTWRSDVVGLDIAVWLPHGDSWVRESSTGTALAASHEAGVTARSITSNGAGLLISGGVLSYDDGVVLRPAVWQAPSADGPWRRIDLPGEGSIAEAQGATCDDTGCLVSGRIDEHSALWRVAPDGHVRAVDAGADDLALPDHYAVVPPAKVEGTPAIVVPDGEQSRVLVNDGSWRETAGPAGLPVAAAGLGDRLYVATQTGEVGGALWWAGIT